MEKQIFKVGDKVFDIRYGWGEVTYIATNGSYPVSVRFDDESCSYDFNGVFMAGQPPMLSFTEYTLQGFSQERPIELPEKGELVLVRDNDNEYWRVFIFRDFDGLNYHCESLLTEELIKFDQCKRFKFID